MSDLDLEGLEALTTTDEWTAHDCRNGEAWVVAADGDVVAVTTDNAGHGVSAMQRATQIAALRNRARRAEEVEHLRELADYARAALEESGGIGDFDPSVKDAFARIAYAALDLFPATTGGTKQMRWYLDTEFNEDGRTIELISIALVPQTKLVDSYYAVSSEFDPDRCNDWVKANVLPHLPPRETWKPRAVIRDEIERLLLHDREAAAGYKPEIWAYFADYDWVAFCQLFGRMVDLPKGMPMFCRDLRQLMDDRGVKRSELPALEGTEHNALDDARWVRAAHHYLLAKGG